MISDSFYFGRKKSCFGHYTPAQEFAQGRSVLIVPSIFGEALRTHWVNREVSKLLTGQGYDVLRFDFDGDGNSRSETTTVSAQDWVGNIQDAYAALVARSKATSVAVYAIRFGAGLSLSALQAYPVESYVLWDPIISGKTMRDVFAGPAISTDNVPPMNAPFSPKARLSGFSQVGLGKEFSETFLQINDVKTPDCNIQVIRTEPSIEKLEGLSASQIVDVNYPTDWQMNDLPVIFAPKLISTVCEYL